jgi:hypothetical protein
VKVSEVTNGKARQGNGEHPGLALMNADGYSMEETRGTRREKPGLRITEGVCGSKG